MVTLQLQPKTQLNSARIEGVAMNEQMKIVTQFLIYDPGPLEEKFTLFQVNFLSIIYIYI